MTSIYERLQALQINLPEVPPSVVDGYVPSFVPFVRTGNLIYLSGRLAKKDGKPFSGKVGQEITTAEGRQAARDVAIELLATLHGALHDLNRVKLGDARRACPQRVWRGADPIRLLCGDRDNCRGF